MVARGIDERDGYRGYRTHLVQELQAKGIRDPAVLRAIGQVPRHLFVPESVRHRAYEDSALPIGAGQTISQPWVQARYLELARPSTQDKVLEVGTGSGYQTALLALLAGQVFSVERIPALAAVARQILAEAGVRNVTVLVGDGSLGWRACAPFDAILVAAAAPEIPAPLVAQLAPEGRLIIPLGDRSAQTLTLVTRHEEGIRTERLSDVRFVPLVGQHGFADESPRPTEPGWNY